METGLATDPVGLWQRLYVLFFGSDEELTQDSSLIEDSRSSTREESARVRPADSERTYSYDSYLSKFPGI